MKLEEVDFDCFPNVTVLKLNRDNLSPVQLDLSGLKHLKILELDSERNRSTEKGKENYSNCRSHSAD